MKWISVINKLPKEYEYVLCYSRDRGIVSDCFTGYVAQDGRPEFKGTREEWDMNITHWMPLPEPPQLEDRICPMTSKNCEFICLMVDCFLLSGQNAQENKIANNE